MPRMLLPADVEPGRGAIRVARGLGASQALRADLETWAEERLSDSRFARFSGHLSVLRDLFVQMLNAVDAELRLIAVDAETSGWVYQRCRVAERQISHVRRAWEWYTAKYDQRLDEATSQVLLAADELVRSCWTQPFVELARQPPPGPLIHLDPRFDAAATARVSVPADLRAPADAIVAAFVREIPVPVIALPAICSTEPWWLVLAAHEVGHHVQVDLLPDLVAKTAEELTTTVIAISDEERANEWSRWGREAFADVFSVLMVGEAAAWAVDELQHAPLASLIRKPRPGDRYPPPLVRTALLAETVDQLGLPRSGPGRAELRAVLDQAQAADISPSDANVVRWHLDLVPAVATALIGLRVEGRPWHEICASSPGEFGPGGKVGHWTHRLTRTWGAVPSKNVRSAARWGAAAGVQAYIAAISTDDLDSLQPLRENLPRLLATVGPPGTLAPVPSVDVAIAGERLLQLLCASSEEDF